MGEGVHRGIAWRYYFYSNREGEGTATAPLSTRSTWKPHMSVQITESILRWVGGSGPDCQLI